MEPDPLRLPIDGSLDLHAFAPADVKIAASYVIQAGGYLGPLQIQAGRDPIFGPQQITLANGTTQPNPLATTWRFPYGRRSDGQN